MQHLQNPNGAGLQQTHRSPHQIDRAGLRPDARNRHAGALHRHATRCNMKVRIKLFAAARELAGRDTLEIDVPPGATIANARAAVIATVPALERIVSHSVWAVGAEYVRD